MGPSKMIMIIIIINDENNNKMSNNNHTAKLVYKHHTNHDFCGIPLSLGLTTRM